MLSLAMCEAWSDWGWEAWCNINIKYLLNIVNILPQHVNKELAFRFMGWLTVVEVCKANENIQLCYDNLKRGIRILLGAMYFWV